MARAPPAGVEEWAPDAVTDAPPPPDTSLVRGLAVVTVVALVVSGIAPYDRTTW